MGKKNRLSYDADSVKKDVEKQKQRKSRGKVDRIKFDDEVTKLLICPPSGKKKPLFKEVLTHSIWSQAKGKFAVNPFGCAKAFDEKCKVCNKGFSLYNYFKKNAEDEYENGDRKDDELSKMEKAVSGAYRNRTQNEVNAVNVGKKSKTAQVSSLPQGGLQAVLDQLEETDSLDFCNPKTGKVLKIKHDGEKGFNRKYKVTAFMDSEISAKLLKKLKIDEDELIDSMVDLDGLQPAYSEKEAEKFLDFYAKKHKKYLKNLDEEDEELVEDEDGDEEDEDEDDEDEKPRKKRQSKKDDDDEDVEDDEDEEDDDEDPEEDEDSDDEDEDDEDSDDESDEDDSDEDDDDDDIDEDEEEEPRPKKKSKKKAKKTSKKATKKKSKKKR